MDPIPLTISLAPADARSHTNQPMSILIMSILVEFSVVHDLVFDRGLQ